MQSVLIVVELFVSAGLIIVIMLQRSEGGALGMGGGGGGGLGGLFSPRGAADTLTRTTAILAALFFITCLALNLLALRGHGSNKSILDTNAPAASQTAPKQTVPAAPAKAPAPAVPTPH